jgi:hypothetical protein
VKKPPGASIKTDIGLKDGITVNPKSLLLPINSLIILSNKRDTVKPVPIVIPSNKEFMILFFDAYISALLKIMQFTMSSGRKMPSCLSRIGKYAFISNCAIVTNVPIITI